jgi:hypothetical protein
MFERYTEKARRVIFFARYEASQFGSPAIDTEHILLGLFREDKRAFSWAPKAQHPDVIRHRIESWIPKHPPISTAVDLPLSKAAKSLLLRARDEGDRLNSKHIGTEHLFLALLQESDGPITQVLREFGADLEKLRVDFAKQMQEPYSPSTADRVVRERILQSALETISIHGTRRPLGGIVLAAVHYRQQNAYWRRQSWTPRDSVVERKTGHLSLDLSLAEDADNFELLKDGWKKDHCGICQWELFESKEDAQHGVGYTNGRDWICTECYEKFWSRPDFISGSYSELT